MSHRMILPDPLEFARRGESLSGEVALAALPRLADVLAAPSGVARFEVRGESMGRDRFLLLAIVAEPKLRCQRCLGSMGWPLTLDSRLLLVPPGQSLPDDELEDDSSDPIVAERDLDVFALVEEELLLGLPIAPRHKVCETPHGHEQDEKASPFAVLARLRNKE